MEDGADGEQTLREGTDFASPDELRELLRDEATRTVRRDLSEGLAEAVAREVRWLQMTGQTPGGLPWDRQPAWRVRLWEHLIDERERAEMMASAIAGW